MLNSGSGCGCTRIHVHLGYKGSTHPIRAGTMSGPYQNRFWVDEGNQQTYFVTGLWGVCFYHSFDARPSPHWPFQSTLLYWFHGVTTMATHN